MASSPIALRRESEEPIMRLAVLIDADNAQATVIENLLAEIALFGEATVKRIYGDFTSSSYIVSSNTLCITDNNAGA